MVDSVKIVDEDALRRIHASYAGKLHKGHGIVAATSSIPSTYQTIVTVNTEKKGFSSKVKRFDDSALNENPGPGSYVGHTIFEPNKTSFSKKGYGGFVSNSRRVAKTFITSGPGAGKYAMPSLLQSKHDFNRANMSIFHKPIAQAHYNREDLPAPNSYDPVLQPKGKVNNCYAGAAFKSSSKRESSLEDRRGNPGPGQYEIGDETKGRETKMNSSSFKVTGDRNFLPKNQNPGPGTYKPHEPVEPANRTLFPKKHYLCLSAPAMALPPPPIGPGPGAYELRDYDGPPKHYMSSAVFVSSSSRWQNITGDPVIPGPGTYHPLKQGKESFIYNHANRWI